MLQSHVYYCLVNKFRRHVACDFGSYDIFIKKKTPPLRCLFLAGAQGLETRCVPLAVPKILFGLERRRILTAAPLSPRFIRHRRRFGDDARHAPRASGSVAVFVIKKKTPPLRCLFLAGAEGLEPSARGFGDKYSFLIYSYLQTFGGHIGGHILFFIRKMCC